MTDLLPEVLIVDDLDVNVKVLNTLLRRNGYSVRDALSGQDAINAINEKLPDVVLLDVNMPYMDGFETCERIKTIKEAADIPIIFVSAKDATDDKVRGFQVGGVDYITKPYQVQEVLVRVKTHVTMYQQRREIARLRERDRQLVSQLEADIARREQIEAALRESEARFTQLADNINEVFFLLDIKAQKFLYVSRAYENIFQRPIAPLLVDSHAITEAIHPEDRDYVMITNAANTPFDDVEYRILRPDGDIRWVRTRFAPINDREGQIYRIAGIIEDVTMRKQAEKHRLEAEMQKEKMQILYEFMSATSHEFRTPLAVIQMKSDLLDRVVHSNSVESDTVSRHLEGIREQARVILRLVESLSLMTRLDSGAQINREPMTINEVVYKLIDVYRHDITQKSLHLIYDLAKDLPIIEGDDRILYKAFDSLIDNAIRYTNQGGKIGIRTYLRSDQIYIEFSDTGTGIELERLPYIFERFYRGDQSRTTRGFGLGLSIARKIVEAHDGSLDVDTEPGKGSTFTVILPINRSTEAVPNLPPH